MFTKLFKCKFFASVLLYSINIAGNLEQQKKKTFKNHITVSIYMQIMYHVHILVTYVMVFAKSNEHGFH